MEWNKIRKGVYVKHLAKDPNRNIQMDLVKISQNFVDVVHYHNSTQWTYILEGSLEDETGKHVKGDFIIEEKDSKHQPCSKEGCLMLIVWCGSVRTKP